MLRLVRERVERGWSQFELARRANIHPSDLSQIERGLIYPHPGWKKRLSRVLHVSADDLFEEVN